jgi:hypothetical protein
MSTAMASADDWRKEGTEQTRLDNLVRLVPGASHWMAEMGGRYQNLYWAAKLGKWEFAAYQAEEIEALVNQVALARPKRAASAQLFLDKMFPMLHQAVRSRDWVKFEPAFAALNAQCMACHVREAHAFVVIPPAPATAPSPVLNLK